MICGLNNLHGLTELQNIPLRKAFVEDSQRYEMHAERGELWQSSLSENESLR
jgi:hypothetical protein